MRAESPKFSIAQGNALGIRYLPTMRPVRAKALIINAFALAIIFAFAKKKGKISFNS